MININSFPNLIPRQLFGIIGGGMMKIMLDISDPKKLLDYLIKKRWITEFDDATVESLSGGVSGNVIKVKTPHRAFVVKQPLTKLRVKEDWFSDLNRVFTEIKCLKLYNQIVPGSVPKLLDVDKENYLFTMEAVPKKAEVWKSKLLSGDINPKIGEKIVQSLASIHNYSHKNASIMDDFKNQDTFVQLRVDPYMRVVAEKHPELKEKIEIEIRRMLNQKEALVHGDYSPKNILVDKDKIYIIDFEVAHYGDPAFDLSFLLNHLLLKSIYMNKKANDFLNLLVNLNQLYIQTINFTDKNRLERNAVQLLGILFLARVDGKSPAEYITSEKDKTRIQNISYTLIKENISKMEDVKAVALDELSIKTCG